MTDIITVAFREELPVLKLQAKSIELYCQDLDIGNIIVVVNDDNLDPSELDRSWWGQLSDRVVFVHRRAWNIDYAENGWLTQQLLKILATGMGKGEWSIVLDAKTIFVRPVKNLAQRPVVGDLQIDSVFGPSRQIVNNLFNIDLQRQLGPGGVPFIFNNQLVQEMISEVEKLTNCSSFSKWFQDQGMITEFILYSGYVVYKFGSYNTMYNTDTSIEISPCNLCHSEVAIFDRKFAEMADTHTVSVHRRAWSQLSNEQQSKYTNFLKSRGIE